eukprot:gene6559-10722_t
MKILLCSTGSVASIKTIEIAEMLIKNKHEVIIVPTENSLHFIGKENLKNSKIKYHTDIDEWNAWSNRGDPVLHIELRKWADILVIAPLDANTLAKLSNGLADNLLTSICRAWEFKNPKKSFIVAPAMNTEMYEHPFTEKQLNILQNGLNVIVVDSIVKILMCGDHGKGAMAKLETIIDKIEEESKRIEKE